MMIPFLDRYLLGVGRGSFFYLVIAGTVFVLFYLVLRKSLWFRKIQQKMPLNDDYKREIFYSILSLFITSAFGVLSFHVAKGYNNVYLDINEYSITYCFFSFLWMIFLHDTWFYWSHRMMHHPLLYKKVHLVHHKSINPSPFAAFAFHPLEAIVESLIFPIIAFTLPVHPLIMPLYLLFHTLYNVYGHLGFEIYPKGFHNSWLGKWINTSTAHNLHHSKFTGNYGLYFLFWDRLLGTLREDYDTTYEKVTTRQPNHIN